MITRETKVGDLLKNPIARDALAQMVQYAGVKESVLINPFTKGLKLSAIPKFAGKSVPNIDQVIDTMIDLFNQEEGGKTAPAVEHRLLVEGSNRLSDLSALV